MRWPEAVWAVRQDWARKVIQPSQIRLRAAHPAASVSLRTPIGEIRDHANFAGCFRKVSAQLLPATFGALRQRGSFACECLEFLLRGAPARRRVLRFSASAGPRARRMRSLPRLSRHISASKFQIARRAAL